MSKDWGCKDPVAQFVQRPLGGRLRHWVRSPWPWVLNGGVDRTRTVFQGPFARSHT